MAENEAVELEIEALGVVYRALSKLDEDAQARVISYVSHKLRGTAPAQEDAAIPPPAPSVRPQAQDENEPTEQKDSEDIGNELDGISPIARKWMLRNGLSTEKLSSVFSLGADDIDLVAKNIPGENTKERMRSVFLLEGIAAYLSTGAARFGHDKVRDACRHYRAFDSKNFAAYLKSLNSEISGTSKAGYTLTTRGTTAATELLKEMK